MSLRLCYLEMDYLFLSSDAQTPGLCIRVINTPTYHTKYLLYTVINITYSSLYLILVCLVRMNYLSIGLVLKCTFDRMITNSPPSFGSRVKSNPSYTKKPISTSTQRTLANHLLASGTSMCLPVSVSSLTMSGKQAMNSLDWSLDTASPRVAIGSSCGVSVDRYLCRETTKQSILVLRKQCKMTKAVEIRKRFTYIEQMNECVFVPVGNGCIYVTFIFVILFKVVKSYSLSKF